MSSTNANPMEKVLIVGAGIGGLALAQCLRKQNIPYEIFERDTTFRSRNQGWAIALVECLPHLAELLPKDLGDIHQTSVNAGLNLNETDHLALLDMSTGGTIACVGSNDLNSPRRLLRAGREHFRNYLWNHIPVSTGKQFSHYVEHSDGVTVHFKDGTSSTGSVIIGADGASSHIRSQLLESGPELSTFIPYVGECTLTREQYAQFAEVANAGFIAGNTQIRLAVGRRSIARDGSTADYFFALCIRSSDPAAEVAWARTASKQELFDKCMAVADEIPPKFRDILTWTGPEGMATPPVRFVEFVPPNASAMPGGRVTLLGDAAHAMVPFKGAGANTAVMDACDLARLIIQRRDGGEGMSWEEVVREYNEIMVKRGQRQVLTSRQAGNERTGSALLEGRTDPPVPVPVARRTGSAPRTEKAGVANARLMEMSRDVVAASA